MLASRIDENGHGGNCVSKSELHTEGYMVCNYNNINSFLSFAIAVLSVMANVIIVYFVVNEAFPLDPQHILNFGVQLHTQQFRS